MKNGETPAKKKKFDVFNFFYSIGAVVILIGVIAKFLEWKLQDPLLLTGLGVEALVFTMSAIQYKDDKVEKVYHWDRLFPELVDTAVGEPAAVSSMPGMQKNMESLSRQYYEGMADFMQQFESLNYGIVQGSSKYQESLELMSRNLSESTKAFSDFKVNVMRVSASFIELHEISEDIRELQINLQKMAAISVISSDKMNLFQEQLEGLNSAIYRFNNVSSQIINTFKQIG
jgi:gliding motility-associated protein GldL